MAEDEIDATQDPEGGPWHGAADVVLCLAPLAFLVFVTLSQSFRMPTTQSLPLAAAMMWGVRLAYLSSEPNLVNAAVISGALEAITPLTIIGGAILLFSTMQYTMCLPYIIEQIKGGTNGHPVAEVFLIGWAFAYLIEGASGFGTPVALGAPMLVELGHAPFQSVLCLLIMNTLATPYGAVGTPIWFGFGTLGLSDDSLIRVGFKTSVIDAVVAHIVPLLAATFLVSWNDLRRNWLFVLLSIWSCVIPAVALSFVSFEFSSIMGGLVGVGITALLAKRGIGLVPAAKAGEQPSRQLLITSEEKSALAKLDSLSPRMERSNSIQVATLAVARELPHIHRQASFESTPGDFFHESTGRRVKNHFIFPITNDPSTFKMRMVTRGTQTDSLTGSGVEPSPVPSAQSVASDPQANEERMSLTAVSLNNSSRQQSHHESLDSADEAGAGMVALNVEMAPDPRSRKVHGWTAALGPVGRTMPLWGTILLLVITRIPQIGVKDLLQKEDPHLKVDLGTLGDFRVSAALVVSLSGILEEQVAWSYQMLYVPFILPFVVVSSLTIALYKRDLVPGVKWWTPFRETLARVRSITVSLVGALVLVGLIRTGGPGSPAFIIGSVLSDAVQDGFIALAPVVGALGSFFSGSTTVSNLTFGTVQLVAAKNMGTPVSGLLALQCVGATLGNMVCINNIISARTVLGLQQSEGEFIMRTGPVAAVFFVVGVLAGLVFVL
ncbi:unnamed protein product [Ostreobium quekettii]|uniref:Lactate permease n=1 Tax=Ostreobium quekettii TaxID=121088 RepID=A0A8S1ILV5_9CHLO|nr:unnamed protein product [Ostreobium quekettii]|eukprot:evm.model.scf_93.2 EVM.evm.TU.scf_93.2   scf_93:24748-32350(+)